MLVKSIQKYVKSTYLNPKTVDISQFTNVYIYIIVTVIV